MTRMLSWLLIGSGLTLVSCGKHHNRNPTGPSTGSVTVSPPAACLQAGETVQLMATVKDAAGNVVPAPVVTWASSNQAAATVDSSGLVTGVAAGSATITATSDGLTGMAGIALQTDIATAKLWSVAVVGSGEAWAVGAGGTLLHYDGTTWSPLCSGTTNALYAITKNGLGTFFVVGDGGTIISSSDGVTWSPQTSASATTLYGVAKAPGKKAGALFAVGAAGTILQYDGIGWSSQTSGTRTLYSVGKVPMAQADFAVGGAGTILHYDGSSWSSQTSGTMQDLFFVRAESATSAYALGAKGTVLHYDGTNWNPLPTNGLTVALHASAGAITGTTIDIFTVGDGGTIIHSSDGVSWSPQTSGTTNDLSGVDLVAATDVFAVGALGTILHYGGTAWSKQR